MKDGGEAALSHSNTWPRTNDRSISWILSSSSDTALMGWPHYDNRVHSGEDILQGVKNHVRSMVMDIHQSHLHMHSALFKNPWRALSRGMIQTILKILLL